MKSSFCIDLQRFMLIPTKFPLSHNRTNRIDSIIYLVGAAETAVLPERSAPTATLKAKTD